MVFGIEFWAVTFDFVGKLLIAFTALLTHRILIRERKIDDLVLKDMKLEVSAGILGIICIVIGYGLHLRIFYGA
tara:strand:+ start:637 stop:858 length:222 start_codon:yes stop_codon:yes gene_type:complete